MAIDITTETDTVIKRVLPYLRRRGYDVETDLSFEAPAKRQERQNIGYVDLLVTMGKTRPAFLIEAKRAGKKLTVKDRDQAISYGLFHAVPFVVVTNGDQIQCYNTITREHVRWNGSDYEKVPSRDQIAAVLRAFKTNKMACNVALGVDRSQPYRPGLSLKQLYALFQLCHNDIRKIEKSEDSAFQDFSKLLFLKLYEEKCDVEDVDLPYSSTFADLADKKDAQADQVRNAVKAMIDTLVEVKGYGEVLAGGITLRNDRTYQTIVRRLAKVSFYDSSFDSKGAAFEYYVRATLRGKKLGQYFTPRTVVRLMSAMIGREKILNAILMGQPVRVVDPACGTGGFLVYLMKDTLAILKRRYERNELTRAQCDAAIEIVKKKTFYGADANGSVASAAKMNMIVAGDGQSNIHRQDTLVADSTLWSVAAPDCDVIMTNPPFGTSEAASLSTTDMAQFPVRASKGQLLFLQKMVRCTRAGGDICTVIDDGVLNTDAAADVRRWIMRHCRIMAIVGLPPVTFKPNKINVQSSILHLRRRDGVDVDLEDDYPINFVEITELGYTGAGDPVRGFNEGALIAEIAESLIDREVACNGPGWRRFEVRAQDLARDGRTRFDLRYWDSAVVDALRTLRTNGQLRLGDMAIEPIRRGKSPSVDSYVDEAEGYALVIKAGSNVSRYGEVLRRGDFVEKNVFEDFTAEAKVQDGDVLLSSTGTGTLGKCAVYRADMPAIADTHVSIVRLDPAVYHPEYVCDYLRLGFGAAQVRRLYTGSTGLIEITPEQVASIVIEVPGDVTTQAAVSGEWRRIEATYRHAIDAAEREFQASSVKFLSVALPAMHQIGDAEEAGDEVG